jgi:hypothetical protein
MALLLATEVTALQQLCVGETLVEGLLGPTKKFMHGAKDAREALHDEGEAGGEAN